MVVFEVINKKGKEVFIAGYDSKEIRVFPVDVSEAKLIDEDKVFTVESLTTVRRHTNGCFLSQQLHAGDKLILSPNGGWQMRHSVHGWFCVVLRKMFLFTGEISLRWKKYSTERRYGTIRREIQQHYQ